MSVYVKTYRLKRCVFSSFLKTPMSGSAQMCSGIEFHAAAPASYLFFLFNVRFIIIVVSLCILMVNKRFSYYYNYQAVISQQQTRSSVRTKRAHLCSFRPYRVQLVALFFGKRLISHTSASDIGHKSGDRTRTSRLLANSCPPSSAEYSSATGSWPFCSGRWVEASRATQVRLTGPPTLSAPTKK